MGMDVGDFGLGERVVPLLFRERENRFVGDQSLDQSPQW